MKLKATISLICPVPFMDPEFIDELMEEDYEDVKRAIRKQMLLTGADEAEITELQIIK